MRRRNRISPLKTLTESEIEKLEEFMIARNFKLSKNDISRAARHLNLSIKRSLIYFEDMKEELEKSKLNDSKKMIKKIKRIYKRILDIERFH